MRLQKTIRHFETIGQWRDYWTYVLLSAPNNFSRFIGTKDVKFFWQRAALKNAFTDLRSGLHFADKKVKDERLVAIIHELIEMSFESFQKGSAKIGKHILQECEGMIWPSFSQPPKYVVEAERRVFGVVELFKSVKVSPFPYEGKYSDLSESQKIVLQAAESLCSELLIQKQDFKFLGWTLSASGEINKLQERSFRALRKRINSDLFSQNALSGVVAELSTGSGNGLILFYIHGISIPTSHAIGAMKNWQYNSLRYHFYAQELGLQATI